MTGNEELLLHVCPLQRLHIDEQYNHAIRHPHVFRQPVLQPHDTIRSSLVGDTDRSVVNGIKIPSLYYHRRSVWDNLFTIQCFTARYARYDWNLGDAAAGGNDASLNPDGTDDWLIDRVYMM